MTTFGGVLLKVYCSRCYSVVVETPPCGEGSILYQQYINIVAFLMLFVKEKDDQISDSESAQRDSGDLSQVGVFQGPGRGKGDGVRC